MDAHAFRLVARELVDLLQGARVEKIHSPAPDVTVLGVYAQGHKLRLVLRSGRLNPALFFTQHTFTNPQRPSGAVMRLRKYAGGRRLGAGQVDFSRRRLAFELPGESPLYLLLDLRFGASITALLPQDFAEPPLWPGAEVSDELCAGPLVRTSPTGPWQMYSVLTPRLRETLAQLDPLDGRALLVDLETGEGELFFYQSADGVAVYWAWPLPDTLVAQKKLTPIALDELLRGAPETAWAANFPLCGGVGLADAPLFFTQLKDTLVTAQEKTVGQEDKRRKRLHAKLDTESERLRDMVAHKEDALLLQSALWRYAADERLAEVSLEDAQGNPRRLALNPLLTVRENMELIFRKAAKGARGLLMVEERRRADLPERPRKPGAAATEKGGDTNLPKHVARFVSSDGYTLLRGKSAEGNRALLKFASLHDYWLHVKDGPGAHVVIRRAHAADEVPERTILQAAALAGLKSFRAEDDRAEVMLAEVRRVQPVKGGPAGSVRVDAMLRTVMSSLDPQLEILLAQ